MERLSWLPAQAGVTGPGCPGPSSELLAEPVSAVTSLAFVVAGGIIAAGARRRRPGRVGGTSLTGYALLVAGIGVGSVIQHGPRPPWQDPAHDLPLAATLAFVAADAAAGLLGRRRVWWWWALPTAALLPVIVLAPRAGDLAQAGVAAVAVVLAVLRARSVPAARRRTAAALGLLAVGGLVGTLSRAGGPLCVPGSLWDGHSVWHVLAAAALVVLAPVLGAGSAASPSPAERAPSDQRSPRSTGER
ncbi:MAG TPA: hypothetical protein VK024_02420 [Actinomycetaceae bacterium]|nr:hypothetical protein [Actinomycetaceae bacterium]